MRRGDRGSRLMVVALYTHSEVVPHGPLVKGTPRFPSYP